MSTSSAQLDKDIARLRFYAVELGTLAYEMQQHAKFKEDDHLGFMELTFVSKQLEHIKSVCKLADADQYQDASIIARVMVEGLAILYWANAAPKERPLNWRAYIWIDQFRRSYGKPDYPEHKAEIELMLKTYCRQYLKPEFKGKPQNEITPDNYRINWRWDENQEAKFVKIAITEIFKETGLKDLYEKFYIPASGWVHWDSISMAEAIHRGADGSVTWGAETKYMGAVALASGFHALFGSAQLLNEHFSLGFSDRLKKLYEDYIAKKEPTTSSG
jgi:hypothetical protein